MTTKKKFSVPIKEGETDLVSKDDLKTMTENLSNSGSIIRYSNADSLPFEGNVRIDEYSTTAYGSAAWIANIVEDYVHGSGSAPKVSVSFSWVNFTANLSSNTIIEPASVSNCTKTIVIGGISSMLFSNCSGSQILHNDSGDSVLTGKANGLHIKIEETIRDNETGNIISNSTLFECFNATLNVEIRMWYSMVLQSFHIDTCSISISYENS